jgi:hypothetical protein
MELFLKGVRCNIFTGIIFGRREAQYFGSILTGIIFEMCEVQKYYTSHLAKIIPNKIPYGTSTAKHKNIHSPVTSWA